jgi:hypothetical protein
MTDPTPEVHVDDTSGAAPTNAEPQIQLVASDTPALEPDATTDGNASGEPAQKYFGKYNSMDEAEKGYTESQSAMHRANEEAAALRNALDVIKTQTPAPNQGPPDQDAANDQFRAFAEQNPLAAIEFVADKMYQRRDAERTQAQSQMMGEYQKFAGDPNYSDVAGQVMQNLSLHQGTPNVELEFLKAKVAHMQSNSATQQVTDAAMSQRMHVESGSSRQPDSTLRIELDPDANRVKDAFKMNDEEWVRLNRNAALSQQGGQTGRKPVTIDEYRARKAGQTNG